MSQTNILLESGTNELEIVEFYIDEEGYRGHYGINVAKVVEIIREQPVTAMPQMNHDAVKGAFAHRNGRIVPLIDLGKYLNKNTLISKEAKVIITEFNTVITSFLVSGVNRIHRMSWTDVEPPGKILQGMSHSSITGVIRLDGRVVFLLDLEAIVADLHPRLAMHMEYRDGTELAPEKRYKILHADDSSSIRGLMSGMLDKTKMFDLKQFFDGKEAWDYLMLVKREVLNNGRRVEDFVEGIITDIEMPNLDGLTLCRQIKEDPVLKDLPVAIFSSIVSDSLKKRGETVGADAQFSKPDLQALSDRMVELIDKNKK